MEGQWKPLLMATLPWSSLTAHFLGGCTSGEGLEVHFGGS